jgi:5'-deoxynucleotidase YfbR-like HD superfamily hydrolase
MASELLQPELQFEGLMHDAEEAYARDLATPLKALIPQYSEVVARITRAIRIRFDLPEFAHAPEVKEVDIHLGKLEYRTLFEGAALFKLWTPQEAFHRFIQRFEELYPVHLERLRERGIPTYQSQWAGSQLLSAPACTAEVAGMRRLRAEAPSA